MRSHNGEKPFECPTCSRRFKDKSNLKQHEATHKEVKPHQCPQCGQGFAFRRNMIRHMETHQGGVKNYCNNTLSQTSIETIGVSTILTTLPSASNSVEIEKDPRESHRCPDCQVRFANLKTLRQHQKSAHSTPGSFECSICKKSWKNECELRSHMMEHTDKRKRYLCPHCNKSCDRPSDLVKHIRVHTGDKPFQCQTCDKRFADRSLFLKHTRTHKTNNESQVFVCGICDKKFQVETNLEKHVKVHTTASYACSSCGKKFYDELSLQAHINLHNGATPFNCSFCGKEFSYFADMKKHERVHTGEKPHKCSHCDKSFSDRSALRKHERRHEMVSAGPQQIQCLGCNRSFFKEEAFFKHATLLRCTAYALRCCFFVKIPQMWTTFCSEYGSLYQWMINHNQWWKNVQLWKPACQEVSRKAKHDWPRLSPTMDRQVIRRSNNTGAGGVLLSLKALKNNQAAIPNSSLGKTSIEKMFSFGHSGVGMGYMVYQFHAPIFVPLSRGASLVNKRSHKKTHCGHWSKNPYPLLTALLSKGSLFKDLATYLQSRKKPVSNADRKVFFSSSLLAEEFLDTLQYKISR